MKVIVFEAIAKLMSAPRCNKMNNNVIFFYFLRKTKRNLTNKQTITSQRSKPIIRNRKDDQLRAGLLTAEFEIGWAGC